MNGDPRENEIVTSIERHQSSNFEKPKSLSNLVMPGLVPGIHVFLSISKKDVDGRVKPGHDETQNVAFSPA